MRSGLYHKEFFCSFSSFFAVLLCVTFRTRFVTASQPAKSVIPSVNFVEIPSQNGPLLLNLDHITSLQVRGGNESAAILLGVRGTSELQSIPCEESGAGVRVPAGATSADVFSEEEAFRGWLRGAHLNRLSNFERPEDCLLTICNCADYISRSKPYGRKLSLRFRSPCPRSAGTPGRRSGYVRETRR